MYRILACLFLACALAHAADAQPAFPLWDGTESIADYARRVNLLPTKTMDLGNGVNLELVLIPAGKFIMGANDIGEAEKPAHEVNIGTPFYIARHETTVAQFRAFAEAMQYQTACEKSGNGWTVEGGKWRSVRGISWRKPGFEQTPEHPVVLVTWDDAQEFCRWGTRKTGQKVLLPAEAQWEYAARGPQSLRYPWGTTWTGTPANVADASLSKSGFKVPWGGIKEDDGFPYTAPVGSYKSGSCWCGANDMAGNVWEWVEDFFDDDYYRKSPSADPKGPATGEQRVMRGGSWNNGPEHCQSACRKGSDPANRHADLGFRVVVEAPPRTP